MKFTKMHGTGQDYVIVDCFTERAPRNPHGLALEVADRQRGIGARGLVVVEPSDESDARMSIYNAMGEQSPTCLHGLRCVAKYLFDRKLVSDPYVRLQSSNDVYQLTILSRSEVAQFVQIDLGPPVLDAQLIPTTLPGDAAHENRVVNVPLDLQGTPLPVTCVSLGTPRCVVFSQLNDELVSQLGPFLEIADCFPEQTSVDFAQVITGKEIGVRSWERGFGEQKASVEGACAALVAAVLAKNTERQATIRLPDGDLEVEWDETNNHVFVGGSAVEVFSGTWNGLS